MRVVARNSRSPVGDASLFHALQLLQSIRELAAGEHKDVRGIDNSGLKLKHVWVGMDHVRVIPIESAIFKAGARHILA